MARRSKGVSGRKDASPKTPKALETRRRILAAALDLFCEHGYEQTTMRAVADRAGVSTGNAYYYFASKDHLVQGFYARSHTEHLEASMSILDRETDFKKRLREVVRAKIDGIEPYHGFSSGLFKTAADPRSPLNPFSPESSPVRDQATGLMGTVLTGSGARVPKDLAAVMPRLLWLYLMGVILFWVHDSSEGQRRTYRLIDRSADLVARLTALASNPLVAPVRKSLLKLVRELEEDIA